LIAQENRMTTHTLARIVLTSWLIASTAFAATDTGGNCTAPKIAEKSSAVDVPQYISDEDTPPSPEETARARSFNDYLQSLKADLRSSPDASDWVASLLLNVGQKNPAERDEAITLLRRATNAAPSDALTQWMVVASANSLDADDIRATAVDTLTRLEPDNAAVWMEVLTSNARHHDRAGVSKALARMSATSTTANHFPEITKRIADAMLRKPIPTALLESRETANISSDSEAYTYAMAMSSAFAFPAYQHLTLACQWDSTGRNASRAQDCEQVGRQMSRQSETLLGRNIGYAVLRVSRTYTDDDVESARELDWVYQSYVDMISAITPSPGQLKQYRSDWMEAGDETEAMRRMLVRAGVSATPPEGWTARASRFSQERVEQDEKLATERLAKANY
jgi:hypothetical protein